MPPVSGGPPDADGRALEERVWEEGSTKPGFVWRSRLLGTLCSYRPETRLESESRTPPFSPSATGVRRLQPHGPHHPRHLVPLRPEPHHGQVHGETAASVPVHHHGEWAGAASEKQDAVRSPQGGVLSLSTQECLEMSSEVHQYQWHFIKKIFSRGECHSFISIP